MLEARGAVFIKPEWYGPFRRHLKEPLRSAFTFAYHTGLHVQELQRVLWRDVDLKARLVTLPGGATKTGRPRIVPLSPDFDRRPGEPGEHVFPIGRYRWPWYKACVKAVIRRWEKMESGRKRFVGPTLRMTRHSAVRNMSDAGMERTRIMAVSGYVTDSMFRRYNVGLEGDAARAGEAIERHHRRQRRKL